MNKNIENETTYITREELNKAMSRIKNYIDTAIEKIEDYNSKLLRNLIEREREKLNDERRRLKEREHVSRYN